MVGGLILVGSTDRLVSAVPLLMTTSVRQSSSVCSLAKLTNTYNNEPALVSHSSFIIEWSDVKVKIVIHPVNVLVIASSHECLLSSRSMEMSLMVVSRSLTAFSSKLN